MITADPTCETCRHADPTVLDNLDNLDGAPGAVLLCRRYPRTMIPETHENAVGPVWSPITATNWCGEHTPEGPAVKLVFRTSI